MYLITNREIIKGARGLKKFGKKLNTEGPNELRLMRVERSSRSWKVTEVADRLSTAAVRSLKEKFDLDIDEKLPWYGSFKVACDLFEQARAQQKSILFFVHGYNNDVEDVLKAAREIESLHDVIVVPFTWPANGGGKLSGAAAYLSDKADARASATALNRAVGKIRFYHSLLTDKRKGELRRRADRKFPDNRQAADAWYTRLMEKECPIRLSLLCHSMGNYVFKYTLKTSDNVTSRLVFDNICLVAADANNAGHREWVGKLDVRKRVYVVINENDFALRASRRKPGDEQKARLGHYLRRLDSPNAGYIDVTPATGIGNEHTYFKGDAVVANEALHQLFRSLFNGEAVEDGLVYHADRNFYRLP
jgi:esterase/lipase superfamily enzyme